MAEQIIVGAGLSGLVASINLARRGYKVRVLEKYGTVGGQPERWPAVDVTPMVPEALGGYLGIELGEPQIRSCKCLTGYFWGERHQVPLEGTDLVCVERGPRSTALDGYLKEMAEGLGVVFEFEHPVLGQGRVAELPPDTILATGLYAETFDALGIPYQMGWCYGAKGRSDREAEAVIYFGDYTTDYAYWSCLNGIDMVFFFKRGPIPESDLREFEREMKETEGFEARDWLAGYGPTPTVRLDNPRLFASDKILAGTLSGMIEPFVLFGVHGALVSGAIAALAREDRHRAMVEFERSLAGWRGALLNRRLYDRVPVSLRKPLIRFANRRLDSIDGRTAAGLVSRAFFAVPGYRYVLSGPEGVGP